MGKRTFRKRDSQAAVINTVFIIAAALYIWVKLSTRMADMRFDSEGVYLLERNWTVSVNGGEKEEMEQLGAVEAGKGDAVLFQTVLPEEAGAYNSVIFYSRHQYVRIYLDGEEISSYGYERKAPYPMSPGSAWQLIRLPRDWEGAALADFERRMEGAREDGEILISVAWGLAGQDADGVDGAFLCADQRMYEKKERMKRQKETAGRARIEGSEKK